MPLTNFPNGVSSYGVPVLPGPYPSTGKVFFVDAVTGSDGKAGTDPTAPLATLNAAVAKCTADKGDIIYLMPGHYEDIADTSTTGAIDLDVAGISVIGLGRGTLQPRFDFNHADADFIVGADDITIENVRFEATVTGVKIGVAIEAAVSYTLIKNCRFTAETANTDEFLVSISALAACNYVSVIGCEIDQALGGAAHGIKFTGASHGSVIAYNTIRGDYSVACIGSITALQTEMQILYNILENGYTTNIGAVANIVMLTGTGGIVRGNLCVGDMATVAGMFTADTMIFSENYASEDISSAADSIVTGAAASVTAMADD